jgi:hypothetical protein
VRATVERVSGLGWLSRVVLRLPDGQVLMAELPAEEVSQLQLGGEVLVDLRKSKAFSAPEADPVSELEAGEERRAR